MTTQEIKNLNADETYNKIETTKVSIKKSTEYLKFNPEADFLRPMTERRKVELVQLEEHLEELFQAACYE